MSKYIIYQRSNGKWYFILKTPTGKVLFESRDCETQIYVMNEIALVRKYAITEEIEYEDKSVK